MPAEFEFKTRLQFLPLIEKKDRWLRIQEQESSRERFQYLLGPYWAQKNWEMQRSLGRGVSPNPSEAVSRDVLQAGHEVAARQLFAWSKSVDSLTSGHLLELHGLLALGNQTGKSRFREHDIESICEGHEPIEGVLVPEIVENALEWFKAESFYQMHEIEMSALMLTKLIDIHPFAEANGVTTRLISSFSLLRAGYPPAIFSPSKANEYARAIECAIGYNTQPLVDLLTESVHESLCSCLGEPLPPPSLKVIG